MSPNSFEFQQAEYLDVPFTPSAATKLRESAAARGLDGSTDSEPNYIARAMSAGMVGAILGAVIYAVFVGVTGIRVGYLSILVAFLVAEGIKFGSGKRGGMDFQVIAVVLTYLSVAFAHSLLMWWFAHLEASFVLNVSALVRLATYGVLFPVFQLQDSPGRGLLRLFILFVGLRAAWRMTSASPKLSRQSLTRRIF